MKNGKIFIHSLIHFLVYLQSMDIYFERLTISLLLFVDMILSNLLRVGHLQ